MIYFLVVAYLVSAAIAFHFSFRGLRAICLKAPLFSQEEIDKWKSDWLPGDIFFGLLAALLGPVGILLGLAICRKHR